MAYLCIMIVNKKYIRADEIDREIISEVRKFAFNHYNRTDTSKLKITYGTMDRNKLSQFSRRLALAQNENLKNILRKVVKKILYKENNLTIEFQ